MINKTYQDFNDLRLPEEKKHFDNLYSLFDTAAVKLILGNLAILYEEDALSLRSSEILEEPKRGHYPQFDAAWANVISNIDQSIPLKIFVESKPSITAYTVPTTSISTVNAIVFSRAMVEALKVEELEFILHHEISHILYEHAVIKWIVETIYPQKKGMPPYIVNEYNIWLQCAEFSADRYAAYKIGSVNTAVSAIIQLTEIQEEIQNKRVKALHEPNSFSSIYNTIVTGKKGVSAKLYIDFLKTASLYAAYADGDISSDEKDFILNRLSRHTYTEKEKFFNFRLKNPAESLQEIIDLGKQIQIQFPAEREELFLHCAFIVFKDNLFDEKEYEALQTIGIEALGFNENELNRLLIKLIKSEYYQPYREI